MKVRILLFTLFLASCGSNTAPKVTDSVSVIDDIVARNTTIDRAPSVTQNIYEMLPSVHFDEAGKSSFSIADLYLRGVVRTVERGIGMSWTQDKSNVKEFDYEFGDSRAQVETVHLVVAPTMVANRNGLVREPLEEIRVGLALSAPIDFSKVEQEFITGSEFVFLAVDQSPVFQYGSGIKAIVEDGAYFGKVKDGLVSFEVASRVSGHPVMAQISKLENQKVISIKVHRENGFLVKD